MKNGPEKKMKIISFSLWGNLPMYTRGAIYNIELAKEIYPGWVCRFYVDSSVEESLVDEIKANGGQVIRVTENKGSFYGMFWRFLANDDPDMEMFISRDCDSRLNYREQVAVEEWEKSDKGFHIMHDHHAHRSVPILGGMWGTKKGCIDNLKEKIDRWGNYERKGIDQIFLGHIIWPMIQGKYISHGGLGAAKWGSFKPFPTHPALKFGGSYVGQIFNENNQAIEP